ncbi:MAG: hypothetical protein Q9162_007126 [Coniocarpon cinnabarinum]
MTSAVTQLQEPFPAMPTSLAEEVLLFAAQDHSAEPEFHDAPESPKPRAASALNRLPASVQELLLITVDPPTFASLSVLNRHWRQKTNSTLLYAFHLAKCVVKDKDQRKRRWSDYKSMELSDLKRMFGYESRRNLFAPYRPQKKTYRLSTPSTVSSSAVPHGENFSFAFSPRGSKLVASNSSQMYILDLSLATPMTLATFALQRRPTSVEISEDGRTLIMLAPEWRIQTYVIYNRSAQLVHTYLLHEAAAALALTPDGSLLAAAQPRGIEFFALDEVRGAATRRKIACEPISHLRFADNASFLLGTNTRDVDSTTTLINAPSPLPSHLDSDAETATSAQTWLSQPLFPSSFGKTSCAAAIPNDDTCVVAYDGPAETFGLLDLHKMKFVKTLLKASSENVASSATLPTCTLDACLAAFHFNGQGTETVSLQLDHGPTNEHWIPFVPDPYRCETMDSARQGHERWIAATERGVSSQWITLRHAKGAPQTQRLILAGSKDSKGKHRQSVTEAHNDTGLLRIIDFAFGSESNPADCADELLDFSNEIAVSLEEGTTPSDTDLALARQTYSSRLSDNPRNVPLARSVTSAKKTITRKSLGKALSANEKDAMDSISPEEQHLDGPYVPSEPRPQGTLVRQRTAAEARRERPHSMPIDPRPRIRDSSGRGEIPDESDADNWIPPPPQYEKETDKELPEALKQTLRPPKVPERSPARKSASTPNLLLSESQDGALADSREQNQEQLASKGVEFTRRARPHSRRAFTWMENARNVRKSIFGFSNARHTSDDATPSLPTHEAATEKSIRTSAPKDSAHSPSADSIPSDTSRPIANRRKSLLERPLSIYTQLRPANTRSVSQPLERPRTPPSAFPSLPRPESAAAPSPTQLASLHRRQASGSVSSVRSDFSSAPRAAIGAHRRGTNNMPSPWASSLMLNTVDEDTGGRRSRPVSGYVSGVPTGQGRPISVSISTNAPGPHGAHSPHGTKDELGDPVSDRMETSQPQAASGHENGRTGSRPGTAVTQSKRKSFMANSPLRSIPSVGNMVGSAKSGVRSKSSANDLQRTGSRRLQRNGSVRKASGDTRGGASWKSRFAKFKIGLKKNLESV